MRRAPVALMAATGLPLGACGDDDDAGASGTGAAGDPAACAEGNPLDEGELTVATGAPAFPPYVIDDAPESAEGFEAALALAVADEMGFAEDRVTWVGVSFSEPYYAAHQAIMGYDDSAAAPASTAAAIRDLRIGVAAGTTSLTFVTDVLQPTADPLVDHDDAAAKQALDTQQIDAILADLPTALFISAVEIEGTTVFDQFPPSQGEPWGCSSPRTTRSSRASTSPSRRSVSPARWSRSRRSGCRGA
jgi:polar amino acid transport system substrate-binding protein